MVLDLSDNDITDDAADDVAAVLSHNAKLQELYLGLNYLHVTGAIKIARSLQGATSLTRFNLENNYINDEGNNDIIL